MWRNLLAVVVAWTLVLTTIPAADAQYPQQPYPQQQYPQQQYPPQQQQYPPQQQQYPPQVGQQQPPMNDGPDVATDQQHGVARLSIADGGVSVKRGDAGELVAAVINAPLVSRDHLQTAPGSRAEVELDYANVIRVGENTDLGFADLEYHRYQVQLGAGTIIYRVLRDSQAQAEVDTPSIAVGLTRQGVYRVSVLEDGTTQITVRAGEAQVFSPQGSQQLEAGRTMLVRGDSQNPEFQSGSAVPPDDLEGWSGARDQQLLASQSYQHVSRDIYGADDLDQYGNWVPSQYGQAWQPQVPYQGWSPYSNGEWSWTNYYGWTWVDASPWGWAPYHYGRWFMNGGSWAWWPGALSSIMSWAPALVGFFGFGGLGGGMWGGLGWAALAPFEALRAWWGGGRGGGGGFGLLGGGRNGAYMYRNAAFRGGAMTAPYNGFGGPGHRFSAATPEQLRSASAFRGVPVAPGRAGMQFSTRQASYNPRLASAGNRQFFTRSQGMQFGRGSSGFMAQNSRGAAPNMRTQVGQNYAGQAGRSNSGGWQRFGDPGNGMSNSFRQQGYSGGRETSAWHRFGDPEHSTAPAAGNNRTGYGSGYNQGASSFGRSPGPNYGSNYQSRPLMGPSAGSSMGQRQSFGSPGGGYGFNGGRQSFSAPQQHFSEPSSRGFGGFSGQHFSAPSQHFSAPAEHYKAPSQHFKAPSMKSSGGGGHSGGGGGGHGGGHSSGGHHGR